MDDKFNQEISDSRLQHMLIKYINENDKHRDNPLLAKTKLCGSQIIPSTEAAFLVTNNERARFYGLACCHSSWGCPRCTAKRMAEYSTSIACAIDALKTKYDESAIMITFTIPHFKWMPADMTFEILTNTWRAFASRSGTRAHSKHVYTRTSNRLGEGTKGTTVVYEKHLLHPFWQMRAKLDIKHSVRVYEFTWGEKFGWHPHIHALYWLPTKNLGEVLKWEDDLNKRWLDTAKAETKKVLDNRYPDRSEANAGIVNNIYKEFRYNPKTGHRSVYISKHHGEIYVAKSSHYISGWGADMEVANERKFKRAQAGHYSPYQMLTEAYEHPEQREKWLELYIEYLKTTFGRRRVQFSIRSGLTAIIKEWTHSDHWFQVYKKKFMDKETDKKPWKVICWFSPEQWTALTFIDNQSKQSILVEILKLAIKPDARKLIQQLLNRYNIVLSPKKHHMEQFIENQIFENQIARTA